MTPHTALVQQQFGPHAQNYVTSPDHARGDSLERLLAVVQPQPHWRVLDIATGGGHTALACAPHVQEVVATDLTPEMLAAAEKFIRAQGVSNITFKEADAMVLPFEAAEFDLVTCRIAPHHFPDCAGFVREMARVLKPGGLAAVIDNVASTDQTAARHINAYEKLRDPSHVWMYAVPDWEAFYLGAGLRVTQVEQFEKAMDFERHCARLNVPPHIRQQMRVMLLHAPAPARAALKPVVEGDRITFVLTEVLMVGQR